MRPVHPLLFALGLVAGCGGAEKASNEVTGYGGTLTETTDFELVGLRLDLVPTELPASAEQVVLLPQSLPLPTLFSGEPYDAGGLELAEPVEISAVVTAPERPDLLPAAVLPGEGDRIGVAATVRIVESGTLHDYRAVSGGDGAVTLFTMPGDAYQVTVVPDDPRQPLTSFPWSSDDGLNLDLEPGGSIFGRVLANGLPLADSAVQLIDAAGVRSAIATSDRNGFYELAAAPGVYTVESIGRSFGEEPVLAIVDVDHGETATRLDIDYPDLTDVLLDARVVDADGEPLEGITVRFESIVVDGLEGQLASYVVDKVSDEGGAVLARVPAGTYDVRALPPARTNGARHTPVQVLAVRADQDVDLGVLSLPPAVEVEGTVADGGETRLPGAVVACREDGYGQRSWSTVTNDEGRFGLQLPKVPVTCAVSPPADRTDLALTRRGFDPADTTSPTLQLRSGLPVSGVVLRDGEPEGFVVVEVRDDAGELLGSALSDEDGAWQLQLPTP